MTQHCGARKQLKEGSNWRMEMGDQNKCRNGFQKKVLLKQQVEVI